MGMIGTALSNDQTVKALMTPEVPLLIIRIVGDRKIDEIAENKWCQFKLYFPVVLLQVNWYPCSGDRPYTGLE